MAIAMLTEESNLESSLDLVSSASSGELELELSYESSSFESGSEGAEGIHPFLYEPIASNSEDEGSDSSVDGCPRLLNLSW